MESLQLYTKEDAREDMDKGVSAAQASLRKWEAIAGALGRIDKEAGTECGLCLKYRTGSIQKEENCPLYVAGGAFFCGPKYTAVEDALAHLRNDIMYFLQELEEVAKEEALKESAPKEPEFKPITLIIDSEEMADYIWHKLNTPQTLSFDKYCAEHPMYQVPDPPGSLTYQAWDLLAKLHWPKEAGAR